MPKFKALFNSGVGDFLGFDDRCLDFEDDDFLTRWYLFHVYET